MGAKTAMGLGAKPNGGSGSYRPRAARFAIQLPLHYRRLGADEWREGWTENISYSGVLFRTGESLGVNSPVEMNLQLPGQGRGRNAARVRCRGQIVRLLASRTADARPALAARILDYNIQPHESDKKES